MASPVPFTQQIRCQGAKDLSLFRDCLRYCTGAALHQGTVRVSDLQIKEIGKCGFAFFAPLKLKELRFVAPSELLSE